MVWSECKESHASCGTQCHFWPGGKEKFRQADSAESASLTLDCVYLSIRRHRPQAKQDVRRNDLLVLMSGAHRGQVHSKGSCHRLISMPLWNGVEQIRICNGNIKVEGCHSLNAEMRVQDWACVCQSSSLPENLEDLQKVVQERLSDLVRVLKAVIGKHQTLNSSDILGAAGMVIAKVKGQWLDTAKVASKKRSRQRTLYFPSA